MRRTNSVFPDPLVPVRLMIAPNSAPCFDSLDLIGLILCCFKSIRGHASVVPKYITLPRIEPNPRSNHVRPQSSVASINEVLFSGVAEAAIPQEDRLGMELARWVARTTPALFNARETRRRIWGTPSDSKGMHQACDVLTPACWTRLVRKSSETTAGRTPSNLEVNPLLLANRKAAERGLMVIKNLGLSERAKMARIAKTPRSDPCERRFGHFGTGRMTFASSSDRACAKGSDRLCAGRRGSRGRSGGTAVVSCDRGEIFTFG